MDVPPSSAQPTRFERRTFGVLLGVAALCFFWTVSPIWVPVFLGVLLAVVASPLQRRLERRYRGHPRLLAAAITFVTIALGIGLIAFLAFVVGRELVRYLTDQLPAQAQSGFTWIHGSYAQGMLKHVGQTPEGLLREMQQWAQSAVSHLSGFVGSVLAATSHGVVLLIFMSITSYYLLLEGPALARFVIRMVPLPADETRALMREFHDVAVGTLLGIGVIALVQGVLTGVGMALFRLPRPVVWGTLAAVASLLPAIGTALVCVPVAAAVMLAGHVWAGIGFLTFWAVFVVLLPDYWLRPLLMQGHVKLHQLLVLISIFGGIEAFGAIGLLLGPLFVSMFVALLRIYERNYRPPSPSSFQGGGPLVIPGSRARLA